MEGGDHPVELNLAELRSLCDRRLVRVVVLVVGLVPLARLALRREVIEEAVDLLLGLVDVLALLVRLDHRVGVLRDVHAAAVLFDEELVHSELKLDVVLCAVDAGDALKLLDHETGLLSALLHLAEVLLGALPTGHPRVALSGGALHLSLLLIDLCVEAGEAEGEGAVGLVLERDLVALKAHLDHLLEGLDAVLILLEVVVCVAELIEAKGVLRRLLIFNNLEVVGLSGEHGVALKEHLCEGEVSLCAELALGVLLDETVHIRSHLFVVTLFFETLRQEEHDLVDLWVVGEVRDQVAIVVERLAVVGLRLSGGLGERAVEVLFILGVVLFALEEVAILSLSPLKLRDLKQEVILTAIGGVLFKDALHLPNTAETALRERALFIRYKVFKLSSVSVVFGGRVALALLAFFTLLAFFILFGIAEGRMSDAPCEGERHQGAREGGATCWGEPPCVVL